MKVSIDLHKFRELIGIFFLGAFLITGSGLSSARAADIRVAAASSLSFALEDIQTDFETHYPDHQLKISYASSGTLARQIAHSAPFHVFLSADRAALTLLESADIISDPALLYTVGDLVYFSPQGQHLTEVLSNRKRLSIANPETAPYGRLAENYLLGQPGYSDTFPIILGDNAAQAARFAQTGAVAGALIPRALAQRLADAMQCDGETQQCIFELAQPPEPLLHYLAVLPAQHAQPEAHQFIDFLLSEAGQSHFTAAGFLPIKQDAVSMPQSE